MNYTRSLNALKSPEISPDVAVVNKVDVTVGVSPVVSIVHGVDGSIVTRKCDDQEWKCKICDYEKPS